MGNPRKFQKGWHVQVRIFEKWKKGIIVDEYPNEKSSLNAYVVNAYKNNTRTAHRTKQVVTVIADENSILLDTGQNYGQRKEK
ncbi:hypothetical protein GWN42_24085 [candidate division KSB1 bacterium]|nr:hypothetical protein [Phycisphaerae bacterium]NIV95787.1 hypothetical protein [candidate division KSB1 bacterium]